MDAMVDGGTAPTAGDLMFHAGGAPQDMMTRNHK